MCEYLYTVIAWNKFNFVHHLSIILVKMASTRMHDPESYNRIFILGAKNCTDDSLREMFSQFGTVKDVYFVKDRRTEERKGICA